MFCSQKLINPIHLLLNVELFLDKSHPNLENV